MKSSIKLTGFFNLPLLLLFVALSSFAQSVAQQDTNTQIFGPLNEGDVLIYDSAFDNAWRIDLASGERTLYYQNLSDKTFHSWYIDRHRQAIYGIQVPRALLGSESFDATELVRIDLKTGQETQLLQQKYLYSVDAFPPNSNELLLAYKTVGPNNELPNPWVIPDLCLFNLSNRSCQMLGFQAASDLSAYGQRYWIDERTVLTNPISFPILIRSDLYSDDFTELLNEWDIFTFTPVPRSRNLLVLAEPKALSKQSTINAGFYLLNLDSLALSEQLHPAPKFDQAEIQISPDGNYLLFNWGHLRQPTLQIIERATWKTIYETNEPMSLNWLSDSKTLFGRIVYTLNNDERSTTFVRVNVVTGYIKKLYETNGLLYSTVVQ